MATNLIEIQEHLNTANLKYHVEQPQDAVIVSFGGMTDYICPKTGRDELLIVIKIEEDGAFLKIFAPYCFELKGAAFPDEAKTACLDMCYRTKGVQAELDPQDGEVRMIIEFPIEDATLTARQLHRCIMSLSQVIDQFAPIFRAAAETGDYDWSAWETRPASVDRMELADLIRAAGGVEGLREMLRSR